MSAGWSGGWLWFWAAFSLALVVGNLALALSGHVQLLASLHALLHAFFLGHWVTRIFDERNRKRRNPWQST